jgi:hypothetical protein
MSAGKDLRKWSSDLMLLAGMRGRAPHAGQLGGVGGGAAYTGQLGRVGGRAAHAGQL